MLAGDLPLLQLEAHVRRYNDGAAYTHPII
jgi:hypothetical protein